MSASSAQRITDPLPPLPSLAEAIELHASGTGDPQRHAVAHCNRLLAGRPAEERIEWALANLPGEHVLSSSFGAQAAVSLHLVNRLRPGIPVIFIDTGYLFPETYQFVDHLVSRLDLNLRIYRSELSPAWQESRFGRRWEQGLTGIEAYNRDNKVEPMERALRQLAVGTWFAGLRRSQASTRTGVQILDWSGGERWKVHPIADWSDRDVHRYLEANGLPYHPLWQQGYVSIGDAHSTRPLQEVGHIDETRFGGLKRECGLHEINLSGL
ncbi:MAG: phosphoadenosine phosphosulfate reductase [Gammaproteobacteria bacterium]|nr:MAG: phosphoadenylyl-sulfate reductase [Pseudomonadota bacterium]MBC6944175.1 phosphoadenylyl-sulfate reductase [Gammaproteobacteria bacterium]MDL1879568.1 phosphoadenylyl-sulfate reductase [Gammaproteobacteria bacterium PRO2]GIK33491.1 MAG: phosphoadenosine phosphosulfate reductase [Gammaproteobacteria bacterium]